MALFNLIQIKPKNTDKKTMAKTNKGKQESKITDYFKLVKKPSSNQQVKS